jgi:hypothetical protein
MMAAIVSRRLAIRRSFEIATALARARAIALKGYPVQTSKKKRACVVTYRHSGEQLFEISLSASSNVTNL